MELFWIIWEIAAQVVTVAVVLHFVISRFVPISERNSTTLLCRDRQAQMAVARALGKAIGNPTHTLNTAMCLRFFFSDFTSVDWMAHLPDVKMMYTPSALKQVILPFLEGKTPLVIAREMGEVLGKARYSAQTIEPDPSFSQDDIAVLLSDAFQDKNGSGFGILVRKPALNIRGQKPLRFRGWNVSW